jgi:hypothetical protein
MPAVDSLLDQVPSYSLILLTVEDKEQSKKPKKESEDQHQIHFRQQENEKRKTYQRTQGNPFKELRLCVHFFPILKKFQKGGTPAGPMKILFQIKRRNKEGLNPGRDKKSQQQQHEKEQKQMIQKYLLDGSTTHQQKIIPIQEKPKGQEKKSHRVTVFDEEG